MCLLPTRALRFQLIVPALVLIFAMPSDGIAHGDLGLLQLSLTPVSSGLNLPVHIANAGDGSGRLFVVEQGGRIRVIKNGVLLNTPFLSIGSRVSCCGEQGLLSVAFPPGYSGKGYFYVNYTDLSGDTVVARYHVTADPDIADPGDEEIILRIDQPFANHNGGQIAFGPDGYLYIGVGDGGSAGDPNNFAQNLNNLPGNRTLLGKLLRIGVESAMQPYSVPPDNPVLNGSRREIWAVGLRNPWRFSFDRQTGDLFIGDVGQNAFEEIDYQPASSMGGENYGWRIMEGAYCYDPPACDQSGLTLPAVEYDHSQGCSVTGGAVYRGGYYPRMRGLYFYADFCSGRIWGLRRETAGWQNTLLLDTAFSITTFGDDEAGDLYVADYAGGNIYKVVDTFAVMPVPAGQQTFSYPPIPIPVVDVDPSRARPVSAGPVALGRDLVRLRVDLPPIGGSADIYLGVYAPSIDPVHVYILRPDNTFQPLSDGPVQWKEKTTGPVDETPLGDIPLSTLPSGTYALYLAVTSAGSIDRYYLWTTSFVIP